MTMTAAALDARGGGRRCASWDERETTRGTGTRRRGIAAARRISMFVDVDGDGRV
jgi:hypothetical protein